MSTRERVGFEGDSIQINFVVLSGRMSPAREVSRVGPGVKVTVTPWAEATLVK